MLLDQESWCTACNSVDMLQKVLEDSEKRELEQEAMEWELKTEHEVEWKEAKTLLL